MRILGLDPAMRTGWALWEGGDFVSGGVWDLRDKGKVTGRSLFKLQSELGMRLGRRGLSHVSARSRGNDAGDADAANEGSRVDIVAFESARHRPIHNAVYSVAVRSELIGMIKWACYEAGALCRGWGIMEIKRHATGDVVATKDRMLLAARRKWGEGSEYALERGGRGIEIVDDNEADAMWIVDLTLAAMRRQGLTLVGALEDVE